MCIRDRGKVIGLEYGEILHLRRKGLHLSQQGSHGSAGILGGIFQMDSRLFKGEMGIRDRTGVMLAPLVVVCTSLQTAAALSLVFLVLSVPVQLAAGLGGRYLPKPLWLPAMLVLSAVLLYPCLLYTSKCV